jgi:hypothetical protein
MKAMRKCNDEIYQLAKDQALVKKFEKIKNLGLFVYALIRRRKCPTIQQKNQWTQK